jgi:hypothetical protein
MMMRNALVWFTLSSWLGLYTGNVPVVRQITPQTDSTSVFAAGDTRVMGESIALGVFKKHMFTVRDGKRVVAGNLLQTLEERPQGRLLSVQTFDYRGQTTVDSSLSDHATLKPIRHRSHNPKRVMALDFSGSRIVGTYRPAKGEAKTIDQNAERPVFDSNISDLVIAALPLKPGFAARIPCYIYEQGGLVWYDVSVADEVTLTMKSAGRIACWKVVANAKGRKSTYWIRKEPREVVRVEVEIPGGRFLIERVDAEE